MSYVLTSKIGQGRKDMRHIMCFMLANRETNKGSKLLATVVMQVTSEE